MIGTLGIALLRIPGFSDNGNYRKGMAVDVSDPNQKDEEEKPEEITGKVGCHAIRLTSGS